MRRLLAWAMTLGVVGAAGGLGSGVAVADLPRSWDHPSPPVPAPAGADQQPTIVYAVGGARPPGIAWYEITSLEGAGYFPGTRREIIDYPAGAPFNWVPSMFMEQDPRDQVSIGVAVQQAADSLDKTVRTRTEPAAAVGLSLGTLAVNNEIVRLAGDRNAPSPDRLSFTVIGDPVGHHAFGQSMLASIFPPGSTVPVLDYTMPQRVDSQYDQKKIVAVYDGFADFPDRPDNLISVANSLAGSAIGHTPAAFTRPDMVPPQNVRSTVNSRGATTTTYLVPINNLPLTLPLRYLGVPDWSVDMLDGALQPIIDAGYSRNDDLVNRPVSVDRVNGMDPVADLDPGTRATVEQTIATVRGLLSTD